MAYQDDYQWIYNAAYQGTGEQPPAKLCGTMSVGLLIDASMSDEPKLDATMSNTECA